MKQLNYVLQMVAEIQVYLSPDLLLSHWQKFEPKVSSLDSSLLKIYSTDLRASSCVIRHTSTFSNFLAVNL